MRPNVIVLLLDAARRDALEPYGAAPGSSPAIAQLASRGKAVDEVYATGCWTAPSHVSVFTGLMPRSLGLAGLPGGKPADLRAGLESVGERMLPAVLRKSGYRTLVASANLWISPDSGFAIGVDDFQVVHSGRQVSLEGRSLRARLSRWNEALRARSDDGAAEIERLLAPRLAESPEPFFCFVNLIETHSPYLAPRPFAVGGPIERVLAMEDAARHYTLGGVWRTCAGDLPLTDAARDRLRRQYAASIRAIDSCVGTLLENLDATGRLDDTLVIATADHGENLGEGGLIAHGLSLDNRLINVPFVFAGPAAEASVPTSLAGLPRFIAESAGIADHPWPADDLPAGIGVAQHDPPVEPADPRIDSVFRGVWRFDDEAVRLLTSPLTCAVSGNRKLLVDGERELWIDLDKDPLELAPADAASAPEADLERLAALRAALAHPAVTASRPFRAGATGAATAAETADLEERMRVLGYL
jgi:arylsulfatase A-like enzyme